MMKMLIFRALPKKNLNTVVRANINRINSKSLSTKVTIDIAKSMARKYSELPNDLLITIATLGDQEAREERLIRDIMTVDNCSWDVASKEFLKIVSANRKGLFIATLPYKIVSSLQ